MIKRARVSRPFYLTLLAIASLVVLSHFALARTQQANSGTTILGSAGKPLVNLKNPQTVKLSYTGSAEAVAALQKGAANPTALAAADFDADGAMDVVAGYSTSNGGLLVVHRGNPDAFAPKDTSLYKKAMQGNVPPTFMPKAKVYEVPESPDLLATGDFNRDGNKDVLVAARNGALYLLAGDGKGNLLSPQMVPLNGQVTALAVTPDGHVAVSIDGAGAPQLVILTPSSQGLIASTTFPLPTTGDSVVWGNLGGGADLAVGAGAGIVMIYNVLGANAQTETVNLPFNVQALAVGDYIWNRDGRSEISVLADDGSIHILQHGTLNTTPLTAAELPARRAAIRGHHTQQATPPNPTALGQWTVAKQLTYIVSAPSGPVSSSAFNSPRLAAASTLDLMVLDAGRSQLSILDTSGTTASPSTAVSFISAPVAALALPQKINANRDVVVLTSAQSAPTIITADSSDPTYMVSNTADGDSVGACASNSSVTTLPTNPTLREAVCVANNNAPGTFTIMLSAGTYSLGNSTDQGTGELLVGTNGKAGLNLSIVGAGASSTIIQQTDNVDRILIQEYDLAGNSSLSISALTIQNGLCANDNDPLAACTFGGGAILGGGDSTGDNLTLTNVTMFNNQANPTAGSAGGGQDNGGAISFEGPTLTITNSTFFSNVASGGGGAIDAIQGFTAGETPLSGSISITNSTFTNNTNVITGGGVSLTLGTGYPGTISGSTFTGNSTTEANGMGGAITNQGGNSFTLSNSRIVGNSANEATGVAAESEDSILINNWWGCNAGPGVPANNGTGTGTGGPGTPNPGCDSLYQDTHDGFTVTYNPWLVLSLSASPSQIDPSGTSTLTADLTHNSNGAGGFSVPNGTLVTFADPGGLGGVNPTSTSLIGGLIGGTQTSTYTAGTTAGNDTGVTATVDNATATTTVNILDSVTVTTSPTGLSIVVDGTSYTAPQTFNWVVGSSHTLNTTSPQNVSGGTEQVFSSWSDGTLTTSDTVTAPADATTYTASFTTAYQLTTQASPSADGTVTPTSGQYFASGATVPVTATANAGFVFTDWTSTGGLFGSTTAASTNFTMPGAPATVTGNFVAAVQITITTSPANLLVSADGGTAVAAPLVESWAAGSSHTIATSSPQAGVTGVQYVWSSWSDSPTSAISHSITVPSTATTYTATFNTQYQLTTLASPSADGSVTPTSGGYYAGGAIIPVTATANATFTFSNWTSTGGSFGSTTSASTNFTMPSAPATVTGNFATAPVQITITTSPANLLVSADGGAPVAAPLVESWAAGSSHTIATSSPQPGGAGVQYVWSAWSDSGAISHSISVPSSPTTYTATFNTQYQLTMVASPSADGSVTPVSGGYYAGGALIPVTATANASFQFNNWTSTGGSFGSTTSASTSFTMPSAPATVTGNFAATTVQIMVGTSPTGRSFTVDTVPYTSTQTFTWMIGSSHTIATTSPQAGGPGTQYVFSSWSDSGAISHSVSAPSTATTYTANFITQYELTTTANPSNGGTVSPPSGNFYTSGMIVPLAATANADFTFSNWTGSVANSTSPSTTITMIAPESVTANFIAPQISLNPGDINFGEVYLFNLKFKNVTVKNVGTSPLKISNVSLTQGGGTAKDDFTFVNQCPPSLAVGKSCDITVFLFAGNIGNLSATLNFADNAPGTPQEVGLSAHVINPRAGFKPSSLNFGAVEEGKSSTQTITLTNTGTTTLNIASIGITGANASDFSRANACPSSLTPGDNCTISVTFKPETMGSFSANLTVQDNAQNPTQNVSLFGNGSH